MSVFAVCTRCLICHISALLSGIDPLWNLEYLPAATHVHYLRTLRNGNKMSWHEESQQRLTGSGVSDSVLPIQET